MNCRARQRRVKWRNFASLWLVVDLVAFGDRDMIFIYAIKSRVRKFRYVGITNDLARRIKEHNSGKNKSTTKYVPFDLVLKE